MMNGVSWGMGWGMGFGWLFWLVIIGLVIWGVKAVSDSSRGSQSAGRTGESALSILEKRFARGEIDREEFEERKRKLLE